ncbi:MAG: transketolase [Clostridiales bacterium]|nr:transketolase [Clostridiales bacterium]
MTSTKQWPGQVEQAELASIAQQIREDIVDMVYNAKSGHPGGSLSAADIMTALYFKEMRIDPAKPDWAERDRFVLSKGHAAPVQYSALARKGYFDPAFLPTLRQIHSPLQGHPHYGSVPGIEASTGSLGQGGGIAVGMALAAKLDGKDYKVFTLWGDGEIEEGLVWESAMAAAHYKLDNLIGFVDWNGLQIDGKITDVMNPEPIDAKFAAFGWHVETVDGHDVAAICAAIEKAKAVKGQPSLILCKTVKGKGVSFMEGDGGWHGKAPDEDQWKQAIQELGGEPAPISADEMKALVEKAKAALAGDEAHAAKAAPGKAAPDQTSYVIYAKDGKPEQGPATRESYGKTLAELSATHPNLVVMDADLSKSTMTANFKDAAADRFFNAGIAEANMACMAGGLAASGKTVYISTFAMFAAGRAYEQILNTVASSGFDVKVAASHAGLTVGEDGMSHQMLSDIALMRTIPGLQVYVPADAAETTAMIRYITDSPGPAYIRLGRAKSPILFDDAIDNAAYDPTQIRTLREGGDVTLAACGIMAGIALEAADLLAAEGVQAKVLNISCIKPLDMETLLAAAKETGAIVTCEEHSVIGGMGAAITEALSGTYPVPVLRLGVNDQFGQSGTPNDLLKLYGLDKEHIAALAKDAIALKA